MGDNQFLLAGDVGGTKTNLALFAVPDGIQAKPSHEKTFQSSEYRSLEQMLSEYLEQVHANLVCASLGVPGPVVAGRVAATNLPWVIDNDAIKASLGVASAFLLNDLAATATAIPSLPVSDLQIIRTGQPDPTGPVAVIAPGTGLGEAYLTRDGERYRAHASEGGHANFAPSSELQVELLEFCRSGFGHVSIERVCSGRGIYNIYRFLTSRNEWREPDWLAQRIEAMDDPVPTIIDTAFDPSLKEPLCCETLRLFIEILGAESGDFALKLLATGGVYLGGGVPPRIMPLLMDGRFISAFQGKGRLSGFLNRIPIAVICNTKAALLGAAQFGFNQLRSPAGSVSAY